MSTEKIKILLINTIDSVIYEGGITITGESPNYQLLFTCNIIQNIKVKGHYYYQCLINLRIELEKHNYYPLCNGARKDISCSGMLRELA